MYNVYCHKNVFAFVFELIIKYLHPPFSVLTRDIQAKKYYETLFLRFNVCTHYYV